MSLIAGRGCRWPPRRDSRVPVRTVVGGGRNTHDGHENSPILVFFSNLLGTNWNAFNKRAGYATLISPDPPRGSDPRHRFAAATDEHSQQHPQHERRPPSVHQP